MLIWKNWLPTAAGRARPCTRLLYRLFCFIYIYKLIGSLPSSVSRPANRYICYAHCPIIIESDCSGMSALAWTQFFYLTRPPRLPQIIIREISDFIEHHRARLSPYATIERCSYRLEHLRSLVRAISPQRRRKIQVAAERGVCYYVTDVEMMLEKCVPLYSTSLPPPCL